MSNLSRQLSKALYRWEVSRSRSEEKVVGFSSAFLFPVSTREAVTQGGTRGIDH